MMKQTTDLLIIGGGASGLAAAVAARRFFPAVSVCVAEQNHRVGKKFLPPEMADATWEMMDLVRKTIRIPGLCVSISRKYGKIRKIVLHFSRDGDYRAS